MSDKYHTDFGCCICNHDQRTEIESALLAGQPAKVVAKFYQLDDGALKNHITNCSIYLMSLDEFDREVAAALSSSFSSSSSAEQAATTLVQPGSLQRQLKLKEADILSATIQEYMVTLKNLGRKINRSLNAMDDDPVNGVLVATRFLKKPVTDMYVQIGGEIRQSIRTMAELDKLLNGPEENPLTGLQALATAIQASAPTSNLSQQKDGGDE